jgi:hypothetical protein
VGLIVDLIEFSELCGVTPETMRVHIRAVEGSPDWLIERGDRGRAYRIDADGGLAWWQAKREADETASAERQAQLAQLRLELGVGVAEGEEATGLSGRQRRDEYAAAFERIRLRRTMGELVEVAAIEGPATTAAIELRRRLLLVPAEFAAEAGLSPDEVKPLHVLIERHLAAFVDALPSPLKGAQSEGGGDA